MADRHYYFQVDFEGENSVEPSAFGEGVTRRTVVVEVSPGALTPAEGATERAQAEAAAEVARTTANEVVRDEIPTISNVAGEVTPVEGLPRILKDVEPNLDDPGIRAWVVQPAS
ncbi:MAG: hypothetical protein JO069_17895 [Verrucomicrobia bacterium]|nr:hypothetical protein [Verrucomicrobiota bacterium]